MAERYPGGVISKTPPTVTGPSPGSSGTASGVWTLSEVLPYVKAGVWPGAPLPNEYRLYSWGINSSGELGLGDTVARSSPTQLNSLTAWVEVSAQTNTGFSIKNDGTLWGWGLNTARIGDNTVINKSSPVQIGALTDWSKVFSSPSTSHAVKTNGTLWSWGYNGDGQIGDNTIIRRSSPVQIGALTTWSNAASGRGYCSHAIRTNGTLWSWGFNGDGQTGLGNAGVATRRSSPVQVGALTNWSTIAKGEKHAAAVKNDGTLWAWGNNDNGQLGQNDRVSRSSPVQIGALTNWAQISAGRYNTTSVKTDGTLWAWGYNRFGVLGLGDEISRSSPVQVGALTNWSVVTSFSYSTVSLKSDKTMWTWGYNSNGNLGLGSVSSRSSPVQVGLASNWFKIAAGGNFMLAITKN